MKNSNRNTVNYGKIKRDLMLKQGAYDGRFKPKIVKNKKKEANKKACRKNKPFDVFIGQYFNLLNQLPH
jgi:hypothetical protein